MLFIGLFIKTDTRNLVCRPTHFPAAMGHSGDLAPAPSRLRARLSHNSSLPWGVCQEGAPGENLLLRELMFLIKIILIYDEPLLSSKSPLSGHMPLLLGWPLYRGSTVLSVKLLSS